MLKEIYLNSCEESATFQFETKLSDKEVMDVIAKIYAECEDDFFGINNIFHVFSVAFRWDKLKQYGIYPAPTENIPTLCLWGWNTINGKVWEDESDDNDKYLMMKIRNLVGDKIDEGTKKYEERHKRQIEDSFEYFVEGKKCTKEEALSAGIYTIKEDNILEYEMKGEKKHGKYVKTSREGKLFAIGQYKEDEKDGNWVCYEDDYTSILTYREGKLRKCEYDYKEQK